MSQDIVIVRRDFGNGAAKALVGVEVNGTPLMIPAESDIILGAGPSPATVTLTLFVGTLEFRDETPEERPDRVDYDSETSTG